MPTYREICVAIQSQHDALAVPEFPIPHLDSGASQSASTVEVAIPQYAGSQFWIAYACYPTYARSPTSGDYTKFYYFKLKVNDRCLLSWGVGANEEWKGKTVFGIFQADPGYNGTQLLEKRAFFFPVTKHGCRGEMFSLEVFRARARKRETTKIDETDTFKEIGLPFCFTNAGRLRKGEPKRKYLYALIDPVDSPYVTFKYHCLTSPTPSIKVSSGPEIKPEDEEERTFENPDNASPMPKDSPKNLPITYNRNFSLSETTLGIYERAVESIYHDRHHHELAQRDAKDEGTISPERDWSIDMLPKDSHIRNISMASQRPFVTTPFPMDENERESGMIKTTSLPLLKRGTSSMAGLKSSLRKVLQKKNGNDNGK